MMRAVRCQGRRGCFSCRLSSRCFSHVRGSALSKAALAPGSCLSYHRTTSRGLSGAVRAENRNRNGSVTRPRRQLQQRSLSVEDKGGPTLLRVAVAMGKSPGDEAWNSHAVKVPRPCQLTGIWARHDRRRVPKFVTGLPHKKIARGQRKRK